MASPKHLWSGDWERESSNRTPPPVEGPHPGYEAVPRPEPEPDPVDPRGPRRGLITAGVIVAVLIVVGVVLAFTLGGSKSQSPLAQVAAQGNSGNSGQGLLTTPAQSSTPQSTPTQTLPTPTQPDANVSAGPTYDWLGMQINATANGITVGSIAPGSAADSAGVDPGDVIVAINTSQISSVAQLESAAKGIKLGQQFQLIVDRGSTPVTITATLTGRPSKQ